MSDYMILRQIRLRASHRPTGKTTHYHGGQQVPIPDMLRIVKYIDDPGYYLLYCDEHGQELTDTYHESLADAMTQAEWEFQVRAHDWQVIHKA
jgi:hypothetical protein